MNKALARAADVAPGTFLTVRAERAGSEVVLKVLDKGEPVLAIAFTPRESQRIADELRSSAASAIACGMGMAGAA